MRHGIVGIDHPVIAVADMAAARRQYERLGFTVPPRGSHLEWGTGNWCIMFAEDYLELRGIVDASRYTHGLEAFLAEREGLMGVAFGTVGAEQSRAMLRESGIGARETVYLRRNFELPEGWTQPRFALCFPEAAAVPGLMSVVLCQHLTPELMRRPAFLAHANGARRVASMSGIMDDPAQARPALERTFGPEAVARESGGLTLDCGLGQVIRLLPPAAFAARHGEARFAGPPAPPFLAAVTLEVDDPARTRAALQAGGIAYTEAGGALRVAPADACGVLVEFRPPAR